MALFEIAFAVGAIAVAGVVGGILYVLYPSSFDGPMNTVGTDPTSGTPRHLVPLTPLQRP